MGLPAFRACKMLAENGKGMFMLHINFDFLIEIKFGYRVHSCNKRNKGYSQIIWRFEGATRIFSMEIE